MSRKVYWPLAAGALVLIGLFIWSVNGLTVPPSKLAETTHSPDDGHEHTPAAPMMDRPQLDFGEYLAKEKKKIHPEVLNRIEKLEKEMSEAGDDHQKAHFLEEIGKQWFDIKKKDIASYYFVEYGILENSEKYLTFASQIIGEEAEKAETPEVRFWMGDNGARALAKMLDLHPGDKELKMQLAAMYMDVAGQPMLGVAQLQSIVAEDSADYDANYMLGQMAIQSGQFDKAIERGELMLKYHPHRWEPRIFMAMAYHNLGQTEKASALLQEAKKYNTSTEFAADVDEYLEKNKK